MSKMLNLLETKWKETLKRRLPDFRSKSRMLRTIWKMRLQDFNLNTINKNLLALRKSRDSAMNSSQLLPLLSKLDLEIILIS